MTNVRWARRWRRQPAVCLYRISHTISPASISSRPAKLLVPPAPRRDGGRLGADGLGHQLDRLVGRGHGAQGGSAVGVVGVGLQQDERVGCVLLLEGPRLSVRGAKEACCWGRFEAEGLLLLLGRGIGVGGRGRRRFQQGEEVWGEFEEFVGLVCGEVEEGNSCLLGGWHVVLLFFVFGLRLAGGRAALCVGVGEVSSSRAGGGKRVGFGGGASSGHVPKGTLETQREPAR